VSAYSTLGWLDDPVTGPMIRHDEGELVEALLHELVHATVFAKSQPEFNEGVADFLGQEASVRFFADREAPGQLADREPRASEEPVPPQNQGQMSPSTRRRASVRDDRVLAVSMAEIRDQLREFYALELADQERATRRTALIAEARDKIAKLRFEIHDAAWLALNIRLNDACLALADTYTRDAGLYAEVLDNLEGDLQAFVQHLKQTAAAEDPRAAFFGEPADSAEERKPKGSSP
jgi:predicted aminopeptidase